MSEQSKDDPGNVFNFKNWRMFSLSDLSKAEQVALNYVDRLESALEDIYK